MCCNRCMSNKCRKPHAVGGRGLALLARGVVHTSGLGAQTAAQPHKRAWGSPWTADVGEPPSRTWTVV